MAIADYEAGEEVGPRECFCKSRVGEIGSNPLGSKSDLDVLLRKLVDQYLDPADDQPGDQSEDCDADRQQKH